MSRHNIEKLLGGYATNTLTEQEQKELFEAALRDQALFDALADEQVLKEVLDDPRSRHLLMEALRTNQSRHLWSATLPAWLRRPSSWAIAGSVAVALMAVTMVARLSGPLPEPPPMADSKPPLTSAPPSPPVSKTPATDPLELENRHKEDHPTAPANQDGPTTKRTLLPPVPGRKAAPQRPSAPLNKNEGLPLTAPQLEPPQESVSVPTEQPAPEAGRRDSSRGGASKQPQTDELFEGKLKAQAPQQQELKKAREQISQVSPTVGAVQPGGIAGKATAPTIRYKLLRETPRGHYADVEPTTVFHTGDKVRLAIEPDDTGYLYVLARDTAGHTTIIFPTEGTSETGHVIKTVRYLIPLGHDLTFDQPGDLELTMIFSQEPLADVQHLAVSVPGQKHPADSTENLEQKKAGASTKADAPTPARGELSSIVKQDITLRHH